MNVRSLAKKVLGSTLTMDNAVRMADKKRTGLATGCHGLHTASLRTGDEVGVTSQAGSRPRLASDGGNHTRRFGHNKGPGEVVSP